MLRRLGLLFATLALFSIAGGHWGVLQTVAWAEMLHDYSQRTGSVAAAVEQTFDGQHPCELCREIQVAKSKEHPGSPVAPAAKADAKVKATLANSVSQPFVRPTGEIAFPSVAWLGGPTRAERPPTPPPRRSDAAA